MLHISEIGLVHFPKIQEHRMWISQGKVDRKENALVGWGMFLTLSPKVCELIFLLFSFLSTLPWGIQIPCCMNYQLFTYCSCYSCGLTRNLALMGNPFSLLPCLLRAMYFAESGGSISLCFPHSLNHFETL